MKDSITHYIWGYQQHFRVSAQREAKSLFQTFDTDYDPDVFLVGILADQSQQHYHACVEPEYDHWTLSSDFNDSLLLSATIRTEYPESQIFQSHPIAQKLQDDGLFLRSLSDAVLKIISAHPKRDSTMQYATSWPVLVNGYWVIVCIGVQTSVLGKYPALNTASVPIHEYRNQYVSQSFFHSLRDQYLTACAERLKSSLDKADECRLDKDALVRNAGKRFTEGVCYRANQDIDVPWDSMYEIFTALSSTPYEGRTARGQLLLAKKNHQGLKISVSILRPPSLRQLKATRKLLEMTSDTNILHTDGVKVLGLAHLHEHTEQLQSSEDIFTVRFLAHHHWQLWHEARCLLDVRYGFPRPQAPPADNRVLAADIERVLGKCSDVDPERILQLLDGIRSSHHGALVVITDAANSEARRFASQASCIDPIPVTADLLSAFTSVDGAVLISPSGTCMAFGVILDGAATDREDSSRGSRFNSAVRYVEKLRKEAAVLAVVVSSDGGMTLLPQLQPMIQRSSIEEKLAEYEVLCQGDPIEIGKYNSLCGWFQDHKWYLLPEHCERINLSLELAKPKLRKQASVGVLWLSPSPFQPHPHFSSELHYAEEQPRAWQILTGAPPSPEVLQHGS